MLRVLWFCYLEEFTKMEKFKLFYKKYSNLLFLGVIALILFVPAIRMPVQVTLNRLFSFSPSELAEEEQEVLTDWDWDLMNQLGQRHSFSESKDRIVFVNFWATWCPPCVAELPDLQKLYDDYKDDVDFYFVTNEKAERVSQFLTKKGYSIPVYYPLSTPPKLLESSALPTSFLFSPSGVMNRKKTGAANWNSSDVRETLDAWKN